MARVAASVDTGASLDEAIRREVPKSRRSWVIRHWKSYRRDGFEGLIDERVPREPRLAKECGPLIEAAREANANVTVEEVVEILQRGLRPSRAKPRLGSPWWSRSHTHPSDGRQRRKVARRGLPVVRPMKTPQTLVCTARIINARAGLN